MRLTDYRRIEPQTQSVKEGSTDDRLLLECERRIEHNSVKKTTLSLTCGKDGFMLIALVLLKSYSENEAR